MSLGQALMAANCAGAAAARDGQGQPGRGHLASGQVAGRLDDLPSCAELVERIVREAESPARGDLRARCREARR